MKRFYHISDNPRIKIFEPRAPMASQYRMLPDVVFAITGELLHNYLLPRDCPRVTYYIGPQTSAADRQYFFGHSTATYIVAVEAAWLKRIQQAIIYCYEFPPDNFYLLDKCAGYYISEKTVAPLQVKPIYNVMDEMLKRNVELRFMPSIISLASAVKDSSLNFSLIRMLYAR
ncbi:hypothetical protein KTO58_11535 [Chitinophaga pendula]|uniref:DUF6886 family protein n=1 Tax=Chitinophaga pendula TaxID=2849666 RepID=UPI001CED6C6B|nr:DUF6886 family protein [Chitinophaga pendula]UCJ09799.1 hypothetical protein KTO58_11535 [Chitinophaga pendula]